MRLSVPFYAIVLLVILSTTAAQATGENIEDQVREFTRAGYRNGHQLISGPREIPLPTIETNRNCIDLYNRRVTIMRHLHDYQPPYWDDPRNQSAVFLGTIWVPAFYFLGYSAVSAHLDELNKLEPQAELEALSRASAQQRCFEK